MNKTKKYVESIARAVFNNIVLDATSKAQKKYGFDMTKHEGAYSNTHNNEADAFKHAYMTWHLSWYYGDQKAKELGDMHENETPNAPHGEKNMDLWNNAMGREIAYDMKRELGEDYDLLGDDWASEYASRKIYEKMRNGELITNPYTDRRKYENLELELLTEKDRVYSDGEFKNFDEKVQALKMSKYMDYIVDNNWEAPTEKNLNKRVQSGELIYVEDYTRSNGTKVHGYYRRRPYFARKKSSK